MSGKRFIDRIVDHFLRQMIGSGGVGIHARSFLYRIQPREHLNGFCVIAVCCHYFSLE